MKYFLYRIESNNPKTEDWTQRRLIIKADNLVEDKKKRGNPENWTLLVRAAQLNLGGLRPRLAYAIEADPCNGVDGSTYTYFYLLSFEVQDTEEKGIKRIVMNGALI